MTSNKKIIVAAALLTLSMGKVFSCEIGEEFFYCETKNRKQVSLCATDKTADYAFGKMGAKPEMALSMARNTLKGFDWDLHGIGSSMTYTAQFPNKHITYEVYQTYIKPRNDQEFDDPKQEGGVIVFKNEVEIAHINCQPETIRGKGISALNVIPTN